MKRIPYAADPWNEIVPDLWMGGHDYAPHGDPLDPIWAVVGDEFDLVVSLYKRTGHGPADGVEHILVEVPDGRLLTSQLAELDQAADHAAESVKAGRKTLVRCQAGYNRSGLVVALVLLQLGYTADDAIARIRERRSRWALFNEHFLTYIREAAHA